MPSRVALQPAVSYPADMASVAIVVPTHNRLHLFRRCVEGVISRVSPLTREIVIWDNASTDGTAEYADGLTDPRIRVVHHPTNVGLNAYAMAFPSTTADHLVQLDDDVVDAPDEWDRMLLEAFRRVPDVGYLATNLVNDPHDSAARHMYEVNADAYSTEVENGVRLKVGPTGGWCSMTSRELHDRVGGWQQRKSIYWLHDAAYIEDIQRLGYRAALLEELEVHHAGGPYYSDMTAEKGAYWAAYLRRRAIKDRVKRVLLALPMVPRLNERHRWFEPPVTP